MDFEVASFWSGSDLSYFEHLCMKSFVDNGYKFHLFTKGPVDNIPDYVEHHDAGDIYQQSDIESADMRYSNGIYSDIWLVHLLQKPDLMWVDLDVYGLRDAYQGLPPQGSYMQKICHRHNISPETAPIPNYHADPMLTNETKITA